MLSWLRCRLTYANVMATVAVFIALGGSSYAAYTINGSKIKNRSITARKLKRNALTGREVKESTLATVRRARVADWASDADKLEGLAATDLKIKCPGDTFPIADVCVERAPRSPQAYGGAVGMCLSTGTPAGPGRRLPTYQELMAAVASNAVPLAPGGELTADVYPSSAHPGEVDALYVTAQDGAVALTSGRGEGGKAYRCVTDPLN